MKYPQTSPISFNSPCFVRAVIMGAIATLLVLSINCIREEDLTLEQREHRLTRELMCPVCNGQTLDQSQAQISKDMRRIIGDKLAEGYTSGEIKEYFVIRYGEDVLAAPSGGGLNNLAWIMPGLISTGGIAIVVFALMGMRSRQNSEVTPRTISELEPYLRKVDEDIGSISNGTFVKGTDEESKPRMDRI